MNRRKKLLLNTSTGLLKQVISVVCGIILPRYMLLYYGSAVNGMVASIANFLSFISLLEMGVGSVIQSNLYKPLASGDSVQISKILISSKRFFRNIAYLFLIYLVILMVVYPQMVNGEFGFLFSDTLILIISASIFSQYFFGITYQLLLNADQRSYVQTTLQIVTIVLNTFVSIALIKMGFNIHVVKLATAIIYFLRPVGQYFYVSKHYQIDEKIKTDVNENVIKQKWNGFFQHLATVVTSHIDMAVLTCFSTLKQISVYSVYSTIVMGVSQVILTIGGGVESLYGNLLANNENHKLLNFFISVEWAFHTFVILVYSITIIMILPFVRIYTNNVNDINYIVPLFSVLFIIAIASQNLRVPYYRLIKAAGHYKQTQIGAIIAMILNCVLTVALVFSFGIVGAAIGTLIAMLFHTCYFSFYLSCNIINRPIKYYIKYCITDAIVLSIAIIVSRHSEIIVRNYVEWAFTAIKYSICICAVEILINTLFYRKEAITAYKLLLGKKNNSKLDFTEKR